MTTESCGIGQTGKTCCTKRMSWTAVIVGALVGIGISFLLNLFSTAIGLSIVKTTDAGLVSLDIGGFIGLAIGTVVSTFIAGLTAGYLGRVCCPRRHLGVLYGFTAWCLALLLMAMFATSIGKYVAAYSSFVSHPTAVVVVNDKESPAVSTSGNSSTAPVQLNVQKSVNDLGQGALLIFVLFFLGALSSAIGGLCGMVGCPSKANEPMEVRNPRL